MCNLFTSKEDTLMFEPKSKFYSELKIFPCQHLVLLRPLSQHCHGSPRPHAGPWHCRGRFLACRGHVVALSCSCKAVLWAAVVDVLAYGWRVLGPAGWHVGFCLQRHNLFCAQPSRHQCHTIESAYAPAWHSGHSMAFGVPQHAEDTCWHTASRARPEHKHSNGNILQQGSHTLWNKCVLVGSSLSVKRWPVAPRLVWLIFVNLNGGVLKINHKTEFVKLLNLEALNEVYTLLQGFVQTR